MPPVFVEDLVTANRILFSQGVVDAMGHVSMRHPDRPDHFLIARAMAPSTVTADDILEIDFDGRVIGRPDAKPYLERFIHAELYRIRPDAQAVVHSHSPSVIPFGITRQRLRAVFHMSSFIGDGVPVFEIRDAAGGDTDMLISSSKLGAALARDFGGGCAVLQRGHGSTVYGRSLKEAVFRAVYLEINAGLQAKALGMGEVTYLTKGEAELATKMNSGVGVNRAWDLWASQSDVVRGS